MDKNHEAYNDPSVVEHYASRFGLFEAEKYLVDKFVPEKCSILDLGVGGGRTTEELSARATRYVGADYSQSMVEICRKRFPQLEFVEANAIRMPQFDDGGFDAVVFSFNGIDYINDARDRAACLSEIARILAAGGVILFSSHNARALINRPALGGEKLHQAVWRTARAIYKSSDVGIRNIRSGAFARGEGRVLT